MTGTKESAKPHPSTRPKCLQGPLRSQGLLFPFRPSLPGAHRPSPLTATAHHRHRSAPPAPSSLSKSLRRRRSCPCRLISRRKDARISAFPPLKPRRTCLYSSRPFGDYGHKRACNKRIGPGGGTRRLHQITLRWGEAWGRNRIDERLKGLALSRLAATVTGENSTIANDNRAPVAVAA